MKKILFSFFAVFISWTALAQVAGDKMTIHKTNGDTVSYYFTGSSNVLSSIRHTASNMQVYLKGYENLGAFEDINVDDIDRITFSVYHPSDVSDITLADPSAQDGAKRLYKYLKLCYGTKTLSSVMADVAWNHKVADQVYAVTGKYPAMNCYDFIHICVPDDNTWIHYHDITPVTEWADAGGLVSLMWHFNVPFSETTVVGADGSGVTCDPSKTTFKASRALMSGTWEHTWFYAQMDKVIVVLLKLQDAGISALWRPFHEAAGNAMRTKGDWTGSAWFWWGTDGAETYKALWKVMFDYFTEKGVHNLVWVWTTQNYNGDASAYDQDADWYPGNQYVDMIGRDLYGYTAFQQATEFSEIQERYPNKLIALSECGVEANSSTATASVYEAWKEGAKWAYFMPWYGSALPSDSWWKDAMGQDCVISRDQVNINATSVDYIIK